MKYDDQNELKLNLLILILQLYNIKHDPSSN